MALAHLQRFQALEDDERTDAIICDLLSSGVAVDVGVKTLRRIERMVSDGKRSQEAEEAALVKEHMERNTPSEAVAFWTSVLEGGRVIARISLSMKATPGEDVDMDALMDLDLSTVYASIPDLSFSPYAPMFTTYCEADAHDREAANAADDELALKAQM